MKGRIAAWALTLAAAPVPAAAGSAASSYEEARRVLDAGIAAMGGAPALRAIKDVTREGSGTTWALGQSLRPDGPLVTRTLETRSFQDFALNRGATLVSTSGTGVLPTQVRTVVGETGFTHNLVTKLVTPMGQGALANARANLRRDPSVLLLLASERGETLRSLGEAEIEGVRHRAITLATADGAQLGLLFDAATGLLARIQTLADNPVLGDTLTETVLADYREVVAGGARVRLPYRVTTMTGGVKTQELSYTRIALNAGPPPGMIDVPTDAETVPAAAPGGPVTLTPVGESAFFAGGGSHHSLVVVFADHVVVVEAPLDEERSLAVLAKVAEAVPGKPVRYLVPSHYHADHTGGLRTYIAKGVTILTTPGNRGFVERLAQVKKTIRPDTLAREPRAPVVETFTGRKLLEDATQRLELVDIGPNPHVDEAVVAWLPKAKAVFESDLFTIPVQGPFPPPSPALLDFAGKLKSHRLAVETILPGHGRIGTAADLEKATGRSVGGPGAANGAWPGARRSSITRE